MRSSLRQWAGEIEALAGRAVAVSVEAADGAVCLAHPPGLWVHEALARMDVNDLTQDDLPASAEFDALVEPALQAGGSLQDARRGHRDACAGREPPCGEFAFRLGKRLAAGHHAVADTLVHQVDDELARPPDVLQRILHRPIAPTIDAEHD